jgi:hypothetical protein
MPQAQQSNPDSATAATPPPAKKAKMGGYQGQKNIFWPGLVMQLQEWLQKGNLCCSFLEINIYNTCIIHLEAVVVLQPLFH